MIKDLIIYLTWKWECWKQRKVLRVVRKQQELLRQARKGVYNVRQGLKRKSREHGRGD